MWSVGRCPYPSEPPCGANRCRVAEPSRRSCHNRAVTHPWTTPELTSLGRLPMHSLTHADRLSLDGQWRFQLLRRPTDPLGSGLGRCRPCRACGRWRGPGTFPTTPMSRCPSPAGRRRSRSSTRPACTSATSSCPPAGTVVGWCSRSAPPRASLIVELNGLEIGVGKDSHLASEFDLTGHLRPGSNTIRLTVVKWSDATYVEDQDQWWHGGISRSVFLYATGPTYLADVKAIAGLADDLVDRNARPVRARRAPARAARAGLDGRGAPRWAGPGASEHELAHRGSPGARDLDPRQPAPDVPRGVRAAAVGR